MEGSKTLPSSGMIASEPEAIGVPALVNRVEIVAIAAGPGIIDGDS